MNPESAPIENGQQIIVDYLRKMDISNQKTIIPVLPVDLNVDSNNNPIFNFLVSPMTFATIMPEKTVAKTAASLDSEKSKTVINISASIIKKASIDQATTNQKRHAYMVASLIFGTNPDGGSLSTFNTVLQQSDDDTFHNYIDLLNNPESILCNQAELKRMIGGPNSNQNRAARYRLVQLLENGFQSIDSKEQEQWNDLKDNPKRCLEFLKTKYSDTQQPKI